MYPGDSRARVDAKLFDDPRVTTFWDPHEISGRWFADRSGDQVPGGIVWDAYYAFAPTTRWEQVPERPVAAGAPIIGGIDALQRNFVARLRDA
jgi:hypothetical protein